MALNRIKGQRGQASLLRANKSERGAGTGQVPFSLTGGVCCSNLIVFRRGRSMEKKKVSGTNGTVAM